MEENQSQMDRLREHAKSFDGLLSLIPAKDYYGEDRTVYQWRRKKQTKEQAATAKRAKLDPDSIKSVRDVMDEQARKRKLSEIEESDVEGIEKEKPKEGLRVPRSKKKKQKIDTNQDPQISKSESVDDDATEALKEAKTEHRKLKQQQKKEKLAKKLEKQKIETEKVAEQGVDLVGSEGEDDVNMDGLGEIVQDGTETLTAGNNTTLANELQNMESDEIIEDADNKQSTESPSPAPSPIFDNPASQSANTSTSSSVPPAVAPKHIKIPTNPELLKARLAARIEALRALRKADGPNGAPARNRQELMEARRKKEEQRRAHKKELRMKAKAEEEARREEALATARDSPASSMLSPAVHNSSENNFSFGRVAFADGQTLAGDLSNLHSLPKRKGPQDPATALQASEKKRLRLAGLDDTKRADIEEKDLWLNAKKRAHGERVHDDTNLLRKTLKRKEKAKKKSEKEWKERTEGVAKNQAMRQKKREENLRKRKEEKGGANRGKGAKRSSGGGKGKQLKVRSRPGFEGSFTSGKRR